MQQVNLKSSNQDYVISDVIVSLGPSCKAAYHLRKLNLSFCSFPLDWMLGYSLDTVLHLFKTNFKDFFQDITVQGLSSDASEEHYHIVDNKNQIISLHHFLNKYKLPKAKKLFFKKMHMRSKRLLEYVNKSDKVCFITARGHDENYPNELSKFIRDFSELYPGKNITIININSKNIEGIYCQTYEISEHLKIKEYIFNDVYTDKQCPFRGNVEMWSRVLQSVKMTGRFTDVKIYFSLGKLNISCKKVSDNFKTHRIWNIFGVKIKIKED